ncbi:MAG TPA: hypothetical protein VJT49_11610 [Amycolatopsis sp.]|uniref:hypothetical protein n=1 Tax=Amycolatopsis sp. TaxID=37632 RepID=UPI002B45E3D9|nr:hypothetical protein [Amycolatopsis sp.]HKS45734.1 hypothetical protein [Amycolatopsis sp.]
MLARSAITRLAVVGGTGQPGEDDRPEWRDGELVLSVTPLWPGHYAPPEVPNPTPCCADHA